MNFWMSAENLVFLLPGWNGLFSGWMHTAPGTELWRQCCDLTLEMLSCWDNNNAPCEVHTWSNLMKNVPPWNLCWYFPLAQKLHWVSSTCVQRGQDLHTNFENPNVVSQNPSFQHGDFHSGSTFLAGLPARQTTSTPCLQKYSGITPLFFSSALCTYQVIKHHNQHNELGTDWTQPEIGLLCFWKQEAMVKATAVGRPE